MNTPINTGLSVVIPLYNSARILPHLLDRLEAVLPEIAREYEIILVNDGSGDDTWARVRKQVFTRPHL